LYPIIESIVFTALYKKPKTGPPIAVKIIGADISAYGRHISYDWIRNGFYGLVKNGRNICFSQIFYFREGDSRPQINVSFVLVDNFQFSDVPD
jgi:hypothetical protein